LRIFKLARTWTHFRNLIATIAKTIKDMANFSLLFFIFIYLFTLIGVELFAYQVKLGDDGIANRKNGFYVDSNFNNFLEGFYCVFILLNNDGWSTIFFQHAKAIKHSYMAYIYFIMVLLLGQYLVFNLFIAILLRNFENDSVE